ncbi:DinB family protein [Kovacikia minuta CCNUW1]|uniref:DinB family protein n=1 Tax=Kovacikia minuta TaxID=2931930 RepID=UPI001CC90051|nr:DinB family protein [Kovacikia minuta]UBF27741.1 DinB family protein [Kovacikia minuta CCNUW1]
MSNPLIAHFQLLAQYNTLANRKLYDACARLTDGERKQIRQAFFKSIHGTLNHILLGDRIWLDRFEGKEVPSTGLDTILYENFDLLRAARVAEDARIENFATHLTDSFLTTALRYQNNQGNCHTDPARLLIAHFFNHQTHHRGQIHNLLSQTAIAPPSLDMHRIVCPHPDSI